MNFRFILTAAAVLLVSTSLLARDAAAGEIVVERAVARSTMPGQANAGAYLTIENKGKDADKLVAAASPASRSAELHTMTMDGNVMKMREVENIELKPHDKLAMLPGHGYHIMLIGLKQPLKRGDKFPLTLTFEKSGKVEVSVLVDDAMAAKKMDN